MGQFQFTRYNYLPPVIKNLLIINGIVFLASLLFPNLNDHIGLYYFGSAEFNPYQIITHMFAHANFWHIALNMLALWMFGTVLENVWGSKKFLQFYLITGFGAVFLYMLTLHIEILQVQKHITAENLKTVINSGFELLKEGKNYTDPDLAKANLLYNGSAVGASGAIFGVLVAFGMLFPNTIILVYAILPIKAKYFVIIYIAAELYFGLLNSPGDNTAHFAHLGGALFGFLLVKYFNRSRDSFF